MGRDFYKEICNLPDTYQESMTGNIEAILSFLNSIDNEVVLAVGSGGSFSSANIFSSFLNHIGIISKAITPLELEAYEETLYKTSIAIFTASGKNTDIINTYKLLSNSDCKNLLTVCLRENAPIKQIQKLNPHNFFCEFQLSTIKDGFLAVNTLFSTAVLLSRAMLEYTNDDFFSLPTNFNELPQLITSSSNQTIKDVVSYNSIIVLHNGITTPAAIDLESKFGEVGLGNIQLVNFRNFAHGRHCWISNNLDTTSIIALVDKTNQVIAEKTLSILPDELPKYIVSCCDDNVENMLMFFMKIFEITKFAGENLDINPGKPKVSLYGKKLYHISYSPKYKYKNINKTAVKRALYRKSRTFNLSDHSIEVVKKAFNKIEKTTFDSIVFDFDGTLYNKNSTTITSEIFKIINNLLENGIEIAIATGRGKSVRLELQKYIEPKFWDTLKIGYYNGQITKPMSYTDDINIGIETFMPLKQFFSEILEFCKNEGASIDMRPLQITIQTNGLSRNKIKNFLFERINNYEDLKCVCSDHSIDVIPKYATKREVINQLKFSTLNTLCIGDSGQLGGNDFELLLGQFSLSCDHVSSSLSSCWNFAPLNARGPEATLYYLNNLNIYKNSFQINIK